MADNFDENKLSEIKVLQDLKRIIDDFKKVSPGVVRAIEVGNYSSEDLSEMFEENKNVIQLLVKLKMKVTDFCDTIMLHMLYGEDYDEYISSKVGEIEDLTENLKSELRLKNSDSEEIVDYEESTIVDFDNLTNTLIFPSNNNISFDKIVESLSGNQRVTTTAIKKLISTFKSFLTIPFDDLVKKNVFHLVKCYGAPNATYTINIPHHNSSLRRYGTGEAKISFFVLPLNPLMRDKLRKRLGNNILDRLFYVTGFGVIGFTSNKESDLYDQLMHFTDAAKDDYIYLVNILSKKDPSEEEIDYIASLIVQSQNLIGEFSYLLKR